MKTVRIGCGAGYSGDRIEPAVELARDGALHYLVFECLAERTIALAQAARLADPEGGFDPFLAERMDAVLALCVRNKTRIVSSMGAANPRGAARAIAAQARRLGFSGLKVAAVAGDDVMEQLRDSGLAGQMVSANAYLGCEPIAQALAQGADIVVTGRVADPALFLAPLVHEHGWALDDWDRLGQGTVVGHLLECGAQVSGGYFADPGYKEVPDLARLGFPLAEVAADGTAVITKVEGSGGLVSARTVKEQLLYEVHDPARYLTPDVVADFTGVRVDEIGRDRVRVTGGRGRARPDTLKVTIGYRDGWVGEGQISYGGAGALARARLALAVTEARLKSVPTRELRLEVIGVDSVHRGAGLAGAPEPEEARVRVAGRTDSRRDAERIGREVEALWVNGPAGGGGATRSAREIIAVASAFLPRAQVSAAITFEES